MLAQGSRAKVPGSLRCAGGVGGVAGGIGVRETRGSGRSGGRASEVGDSALAGVALLAAAGFWTGSRIQKQDEPEPVLTQLTPNSGITSHPAISADGKLAAFASDRAGEGHMDIWVQQTAGGSPVRLTKLPGAEWAPSFSPDGTTVYYVAADGIYSAPALGGESRLVHGGAATAVRASPDGRWLDFIQAGVVGVERPLLLRRTFWRTAQTNWAGPEAGPSSRLDSGWKVRPRVWVESGDHLTARGI